jgi:hypothetical protein
MRMRLIDADKYMSHLRANINTTSDIIAEQIKKDKPIGTVADGGQIGYLNALQWARASLECDCYTVKAIPIPKGATNGDMIKAMFPNVECGKDELGNVFIVSDAQLGYIVLRESWWNAPYKRD